MRKSYSDRHSPKAAYPANGIRQAKIRSRQESAGPDRKIDSMDLGMILSGSQIRRNRKKRSIRNTLTVLSLLIVAVVAIWLVWSYIKPAHGASSDLSSEALPSSSDLLSGDSSLPSDFSSLPSSASSASIDSQARTSAFTQLQTDVTAMAKDFDGRIGIYYINLANGETFGYGEKNPFVAASSIKMGIVTQLYKAIAEGKFTLTQTLTYDSRPYPTGDLEYGTGTVIEEPNGTKFSVRRTAQLAITISDNCATNMIIRTLGGIDAIIPAMNEISAEVPYRTPISYTNYKGALVSGRHRTSAKDLASYAKYLYDQWTADPEGYGPLMDDLESTVFTFGLQSKLPGTVKVAHKIGTNYDYRTENDVGIIFADETYILCVTTECESQSDGRGAVADISLMFYDYIEGLAG